MLVTLTAVKRRPIHCPICAVFVGPVAYIEKCYNPPLSGQYLYY